MSFNSRRRAVGYVGVTSSGREITDDGNRRRYFWIIKDSEGTTLGVGRDLHGPNNGTSDAREGLKSLLSFVQAAGEGYREGMRGRPGESAEMFPTAVNEFAYVYFDELTVAQMDLTGGLEQ